VVAAALPLAICVWQCLHLRAIATMIIAGLKLYEKALIEQNGNP
jgi:hypothetical protein